jgi:hypothetical protein
VVATLVKLGQKEPPPQNFEQVVRPKPVLAEQQEPVLVEQQQ